MGWRARNDYELEDEGERQPLLRGKLYCWRGIVTLAAIFVLSSLSTSAYATCGAKGGPGYRALANGKCVGWTALARTCGDPPTLRCTPELAQPEAPEAAKKGSQIRSFMDAAHRRAKDAGK
jgi:hypothetical protein